MQTTQYNHLVSLGSGCLPRTVPTRQGYIRTKAQGELTVPFDLALHRYEGVCRIIATDFHDYCNPEAFTIVRDDQFDVDFIEHKDLHVRFVHESVHGNLEIYAAAGFAKLIARYQRRIENFRRCLEDNDILFIAEYETYPIELNQALKTAFPDLRYKLLALNLFPPRRFATRHFYPVAEYAPEIDYYPMPFPADDYRWWEPDSFMSPEGVRLENRIGSILSRYVERMNPPDANNLF